MSVFSAPINHRSFVLQITGLCFVLGLVLAAAFQTTAQLSRRGVGSNRAGFSYGNGEQAQAAVASQYESEIKKLRTRNTELENKIAKRTDAAGTLNQELQDNKVFACLTEMHGPGVQITLNDSKKKPLMPTDALNLDGLIHDGDIVMIVNELRAAGAEALSINGQRLMATSSVRCVGPVVQINSVPVAPPVKITALGESDVLYAGLNLPQGALTSMRRYDPDMVRIEKKRNLIVPAYAGGTQMRFAHPPKVSGSKAAGKDGS